MALPQSMIDEFKPDIDGMLIFGQSIDLLTLEELKVLIVWQEKRYRKTQEENMRSLRFVNDLAASRTSA